MLQLVYISSPSGIVPGDVSAILAASRRNNARDSITGLLYADGSRFLQALEGPADMVEATYARIQQDKRHRALVILSRRTVETREFGSWEMAERRPGTDGEAFLAKIDRLIKDASPSVRGTFEGLARVKRAAERASTICSSVALVKRAIFSRIVPGNSPTVCGR